MGKYHAFRKNFGEGEDSLLRIVTVLVSGGLRRLDDDLKGAIAARFQGGGIG
ncbi:MAG TPA: hypothetical protein VK638_40645 [Edaphobacter sp.]|nr:hypothetical protein [Edaphobacter sp.]